MRNRHATFGFVSGITTHDSLVTCADIHLILADMHSISDILTPHFWRCESAAHACLREILCNNRAKQSSQSSTLQVSSCSFCTE